jgi:hypothetical protein
MPEPHRHHDSTERRKLFTITLESCSRSGGIHVHDAVETVIMMSHNMHLGAISTTIACTNGCGVGESASSTMSAIESAWPGMSSQASGGDIPSPSAVYCGGKRVEDERSASHVQTGDHALRVKLVIDDAFHPSPLIDERVPNALGEFFKHRALLWAT